MLVIENSYSTEKEARDACKKLIKSGKVDEPWIVTGRTGRPMVALFQSRDLKVVEKKVMEYFNNGIITAVWKEDDEIEKR